MGKSPNGICQLNRMSHNLQALYREMFEQFATAPGSWHGTDLVAFAGLKGQNYKHELLVIGRAANGWRSEYDLTCDDLMHADFVESLVAGLFSQNSPCYPSMTFVTDYWGAAKAVKHHANNMRKKAFWRVVKEVVGGLRIANVEDDSWPAYIAWTNLYKISPCAGGNPSDPFCDAQLGSCVKILKEEVMLWNPRRILFLTGLNWADQFLEELGFVQESDKTSSNEIQAIGRLLNGTKVLVLPHPARKPEDPLVEAAITCLA
jgi:hypothetical protein